MTGILTDDNGQILFSGHDFALGEISTQTAQAIMEAQPGEFKSSPLLGVGIAKYLKSPKNNQTLKNIIRDNMRLGLIEISSVDFDGDNIEIKLK